MKRYFKFIIVLFTVFSISFSGNTKEIPSSFADLAERVMPSVVNISTTTTVTTQANPFPFQFPPGSPFEDMFKEFGTPQKRKSSALGSGFIIDEKGIVVTNNHVIQGAEDIVVRVNGDKEYKAKVLGADPGMDIAVLQIETEEKFIPVKFGDSDTARVGDWVIAIGNPFGFGGTDGLFSSDTHGIKRVFRPGHWRLVGLDRFHGDAIRDRADVIAKVTTHAFLIDHFKQTTAFGLVGHGDCLVRGIFTRDMATTALDAVIRVDHRLGVEVHVKLVPVGNLRNGCTGELFDAGVTLVIHPLAHTVNQVIDHAEAIDHRSRTNLNGVRSQRHLGRLR